MAAAIVLRSASVAAACALAAGGTARAETPAAPAPDVFTFHLAIPDRLDLVETQSVETRIELKEGSPPEITRQPPAEVEVLYRSTPGGFTVATRLPKLPAGAAPAPGSPAAAVAAALEKVRVTLVFDARGDLLEVRGVEEVRAALPAELHPQLESALRPGIEQLKDRWRSRFGVLVGKSFTVGSRTTTPASIPVAPGSPPVPASWTVGARSRTTCAGRPCVSFFTQSVIEDPGPAAAATFGSLQSALGALTARAVSAEELPKLLDRLSVKRVDSITDRVVDPATMIVYQERTTQRILLEAGGEGVATRTVETTLRYRAAP